MKTWQRLALLGSLFGALNLGFNSQGNAQQKRVTELSSYPRQGISNATVEIDNSIFHTDNEGYYDPSTGVNDIGGDNLKASLSSIFSLNNEIIFDNIGKDVILTIYNLLGQKITEIRGNNKASWNLNQNRVSYGTYFYIIENNEHVEMGRIIPSGNSVNVGTNRYFKLKNKNEEQSRGNLESKLRKGSGQITFKVSKDSSFYSIQDTLNNKSEIPYNSQLLEKVDLEKPDSVDFLDYIKMLTGNFVINFGEFETNYPIPIFIDSSAIFNNSTIGTRAQMYLDGVRNILKEANDSIGLLIFREIDKPEDAKVRLDYSQSGSRAVSYDSYDERGNVRTDSARVFLDPNMQTKERLRIEGGHEFTHLHVPLHSPYSEDMTNPRLVQGKDYTKADKALLRALALTNNGTYWKKFIK